jgi:hypothetical protein
MPLHPERGVFYKQREAQAKSTFTRGITFLDSSAWYFSSGDMMREQLNLRAEP